MHTPQLIADGFNKLGTLLYLLRNGSLTTNSILFWDEPEANLNPQIVAKVAEILRWLAQAGMQIFISTHDHLLSYELSLFAEYPEKHGNVPIRFLNCYREHPAVGWPVQVESGNTLNDLEHNAITNAYAAQYDREVDLFNNDEQEQED